MHTLTIEYPDEILWALQQNPDEFAAEARLLLAIKLFETGKLSSGLAAQVANIPRTAFYYALSRHGLSPYGESPEELEDDLNQARQACQ